MAEKLSYEDACKRAATDQGLDPMTEALTAAGIEHDVAQTGGFCMVITVPVGNLRIIGITYEGEYDANARGFLAVLYYDWWDTGEDWDEIGEDMTAAEVVAAVQAELSVARVAEVMEAERTADYDPRPEVAEDEMGEVFWAIDETAVDLGFDVDPDSEDGDRLSMAIGAATKRFTARLRQEVGRQLSRALLFAAGAQRRRRYFVRAEGFGWGIADREQGEHPMFCRVSYFATREFRDWAETHRAALACADRLNDFDEGWKAFSADEEG